MRKVGFGVIGLGTFGKNHVAAYAAHPLAELIAVCDIKRELAEETAERYRVKHYADYREMLEDPDVQAVSVATPDFLHKEPVMACAEKTKHVLCEKPLATTVKDAEEMVNAVAKAGVKLMLDFHNR